MEMRFALGFALALSAPSGCASDDGGEAQETLMVGGDRPVTLVVPPGLPATAQIPLVLSLHGYSAKAALQEGYMQLAPLAEARGFVYAMADGTVDAAGQQFWNATDACCDFFATGVDDVAYLRGVIDEIVEGLPVDPERVYVFGHSNGGFMAQRLACDAADRITGVVSLAGAAVLDPSLCAPSKPVHLLQIHGTGDDVIQYDGGSTAFGGAFPSAQATVTGWASRNGCQGSLQPVGTVDLESNIPGAETTQDAFTGCGADGSVALWTMDGAGHIPAFHPAAVELLVDTFLAF